MSDTFWRAALASSGARVDAATADEFGELCARGANSIALALALRHVADLDGDARATLAHLYAAHRFCAGAPAGPGLGEPGAARAYALFGAAPTPALFGAAPAPALALAAPRPELEPMAARLCVA